MLFSRPRFTVRRLMFAVAIAGVALAPIGWLRRRSAEFAEIGSGHRGRVVNLTALIAKVTSGPNCFDPNAGPRIPLTPADERELWHATMAFKYERAARYPWLPVEPDPPEPN